MGALHAGHVSLMTRARAECEVVAVSIFVNPLQFGDPEDIAHYPRTLDARPRGRAPRRASTWSSPRRCARCTRAGRLPWPPRCRWRASARAGKGRSRPGHFDGVATVVAKLFAIAGPCRAYFGEKDFQQLAVVRQMAADLSLPVEVVGCPIVREADGLALSSRNVRLSAEERRAAVVLSRALAAGRAAARAGRSATPRRWPRPCARWCESRAPGPPRLRRGGRAPTTWWPARSSRTRRGPPAHRGRGRARSGSSTTAPASTSQPWRPECRRRAGSPPAADRLNRCGAA